MTLAPSFGFPFAKSWHQPELDDEIRLPILSSVTDHVKAYINLESNGLFATMTNTGLLEKTIKFYACCELFIYESSLSKDEYTNRKTLPTKIIAFLHNKRRILPQIDRDAAMALSTDVYSSLDTWQLIAFYNHVKTCSIDDGPLGDKAFHYFLLLHSKITSNAAENEDQQLAFQHLVKCDNPGCAFTYPTQVSYRIYVCLMSLRRENTSYTEDMCRDMLETLMAFVYYMICARDEVKYEWYLNFLFSHARIHHQYAHIGTNLQYKAPLKRAMNETCCICLNDINRNSYQMPGCCNHGFCTECLKEWTKRHRLGFRCPYCNKSSMTIKDVENNQLTIKFVA